MKYPEVVKRNARYRGPMESEKQTSAVLDISHSILILTSELQNRKASMSALLGSIATEYNVAQPNYVNQLRLTVSGMKGGEF